MYNLNSLHYCLDYGVHFTQRYLFNIVQANSALGDVAIHALETIATEMLKVMTQIGISPDRCCVLPLPDEE